MSKTSQARKHLVVSLIPKLTKQMQNTTKTALDNMLPVLKNKKIYNRIKKSAENGIKRNLLLQLDKVQITHNKVVNKLKHKIDR